jgi:hypothetical protein
MGHQRTSDARVSLPDDEVQRIAAEIGRAARDPPPDDPRDDVLSPLHELSPINAGRVAAAAVALLRRPD